MPAEYLQNVYEVLLLVNDVSIEALRQCADADGGAESSSSSKDRRALQAGADSDDLVSEGNLDKGASSLRAKNAGAKAHRSAASSGAAAVTSLYSGGSSSGRVREVDCLQDVGYNLILRPQYMILVPRGKKDFAHSVNINSFGELSCVTSYLKVATVDSGCFLIALVHAFPQDLWGCSWPPKMSPAN
jgi:hypothetical protein